MLVSSAENKPARSPERQHFPAFWHASGVTLVKSTGLASAYGPPPKHRFGERVWASAVAYLPLDRRWSHGRWLELQSQIVIIRKILLTRGHNLAAYSAPLT
jgi:hypothetical protein